MWDVPDSTATFSVAVHDSKTSSQPVFTKPIIQLHTLKKIDYVARGRSSSVSTLWSYSVTGFSFYAIDRHRITRHYLISREVIETQKQ